MAEHPALLLAIDTSAGTSVAVVREGTGILSQADGLDSMRHAEVIGLLIERALTEADVGVGELTGVVAGMGPGPFTGLRVGIVAARVFALGAGVPLLPVVSHDAIAFGEAAAGVTGELLVVTDARRREVYWSLYELAGASGGAVARAKAGPCSSGSAGTCSSRSVVAGARAGTDEEQNTVATAVRIEGPGLAKPDALPHPEVRATDAAEVSAGQLGLVALAVLASGGGFAPDRALYLRSPDVTLSTGVKRVSQ